MQQEEGVLDSRYSVISQARYNAKSFGDGEYEQIDIKSYLEECGKSDTELGKVLRSAVKYSEQFVLQFERTCNVFPV